MQRNRVFVNNLLPRLQSAYRRCNLTETVLQRVFAGALVAAVDNRHVALFSLVDLGARLTV